MKSFNSEDSLVTVEKPLPLGLAFARLKGAEEFFNEVVLKDQVGRTAFARSELLRAIEDFEESKSIYLDSKFRGIYCDKYLKIAEIIYENSQIALKEHTDLRSCKIKLL